MKIVVGNNYSKLETDDIELLEALDKVYAIEYPGSKYMPKKKGWDGKKHFIKNGMFLTGLLPRVLESLKKVEIKTEIVDERKLPDIEFVDDLIKQYQLFEDQKELLLKILEVKRGIVKASTGAGKTLIMGYFLKLLSPKRALIVTNRKTLVRQLYEFFKNECKINNIGICFGEGLIRDDIMVCSTGSLEKVLDTHIECDCLLVDEIHEFSGGKKSTKLLELIVSPVKLGFTATVPDIKFIRYNLEGIFGSIIEGETTAKLTEKERLAKATVNIVPFKSNEEFYSFDSYNFIYQKIIISSEQRNGLITKIVEHIFSNNPTAKILILVKNIEHLEILAKMIPESLTIQGSDDISSRYQKINKFLNSKLVLLGTNVLQTGVNIKEITDLINARALKSEIPTIQAIGRALRLTDVKREVNIWDIKDDCKHLDKHAKERIKHYKKEGHTINEVTI